MTYRHRCPSRMYRTQVRTGAVWTISREDMDGADGGDAAHEFRETILCWQAVWFSDIHSDIYVQSCCFFRENKNAGAMPGAEHQALRKYHF